jgi:SAM-dependent methyltransferase
MLTVVSDRIQRVWRPILQITRRRRMERFVEWAGITPSTTVLDVGGTPQVWGLIPVVPDVTLLNLASGSTPMRQIVADATRLPFADGAFDIVFSNSVIEHVADHDAVAREIARVGRRYFVQTPNRAFPFEPHVLTPFVNYLPKRWQKRLYRNFTVWGWITRPDRAYVEAFVDATNLLDADEMRRLFPGANLHVARSLIARR